MTLFNSSNPRIAAAHAAYIETLSTLGVAYDAAQVMPDLADFRTGELAVAVRESRTREATMKAATRLAELAERKRRKAERRATVVDLAGRRVA